MSKSKAEVTRTVNDAWRAIDLVISMVCGTLATTHAHHRSGPTLQRLWRELNEECERQERAHRGMGRRMRQSMRGRVTIEVATRYFAAMAVVREVPEIRTWWSACDIRRDFALGHAISEALADLGLWIEVTRRHPDMTALAALDYAKDMA